MIKGNHTTKLLIILFLLYASSFILLESFAIAEDLKLNTQDTIHNTVLTYQNGLLSADLKSATIKEIFEELKKQTGMNYEIEKEIQEQKVTINLKDKELVQGVKEILNTIGNPSYMLSYKKVKKGLSANASVEEKYVVSNIDIRKRGKEDKEKRKRELQDGEMEVGFINGKYRIRAKNTNVNELLEKISNIAGIHDKIIADKIDGKVTIDAEEGMLSMTFLQEELLSKIRPKIYKVNRVMSERDKNGKITKPAYFTIVRLSNNEIRRRREQAQLKNAEGERLLKQGRYLEAIDAFGWGGDPDYIETRLNLGKVYFLNEEYGQAMKYFSDALDIDSTSAEAYLGLSEAYEKEWQIDRALENIERYVLFTKDNEKKEEINKKIKYLKKQSTQDYYTYLKNGNESVKKKDIEKAKEEYKKAIKIRPELPSAYRKLGLLYEKNKDYKNAEEMYKKVIEKDSKSFKSYTGLARIYSETGRPQDAIGMLLKAVAVCPVKDTAAKINLMIEGLKQGINK